MKTLFALSLTLVSLSAQAAPTVLLQYSTSNGSVNPMYGSRVSCMIMDDGTVFTRKIMGDIAKGSTAKIAWKGIRNETILKSLINDAKDGMVVDRKGPLPIGGRLSTYLANQGKSQITLVKKVGGITASINTAESAKRLIDFIETNCKSAIVK